MDIAAKWLKEYDATEKVGDMIVMEHFITMPLKRLEYG